MSLHPLRSTRQPLQLMLKKIFSVLIPSSPSPLRLPFFALLRGFSRMQTWRLFYHRLLNHAVTRLLSMYQNTNAIRTSKYSRTRNLNSFISKFTRTDCSVLSEHCCKAEEYSWLWKNIAEIIKLSLNCVPNRLRLNLDARKSYQTKSRICTITKHTRGMWYARVQC